MCIGVGLNEEQNGFKEVDHTVQWSDVIIYWQTQFEGSYFNHQGTSVYSANIHVGTYMAWQVKKANNDYQLKSKTFVLRLKLCFV